LDCTDEQGSRVVRPKMIQTITKLQYKTNSSRIINKSSNNMQQQITPIK